MKRRKTKPSAQKSAAKSKPNANTTTKNQSDGTETFDINEGESTSSVGPQSHQLKFYKGEERDLLDVALFYMRLYLLNANGFPDAQELVTWSYNSFMVACKAKFRGNWEGSCCAPQVAY